MFGQSSGPVCPVVSILGPASIINPGEPMTFTASFKGEKPVGISHMWKLDGGGEILGSRNELVLTVRSPRESYNITATVEFTGFPDGCPYSFSEIAGIAVCKLAVLADEYNRISPNEEMARLDALAVQLSDRPDDSGLLIFYYPKSVSLNSIKKRNNGILRRIVKKQGISESRIRFLYVDAESEQTRIYLVPKDASLSQYEDGVTDLLKFRSTKP